MGYAFRYNPLISLNKMVGVAGFELATPCTPCKCATRLRYTPTRLAFYSEKPALKKKCANFFQFFSQLGVAKGHGTVFLSVRRTSFGRLVQCLLIELRQRSTAHALVRMREFLQPVACTADGEALVVQQVTDAADHQHLVVLVIAAIAAPLHGPQLRELLLPVAQDMGLDAAQLRHLTDREVALCRDGGQQGVHGNDVQAAKLSSVLQAPLGHQGPEAGKRKAVSATSGLRLALDLLLELAAGMEGHHAPRLDGDGFARARVAPGPRGLGADLEIAEP